MKNIGKPCAGKLHARFDEGGQERRVPALYSTLLAGGSVTLQRITKNGDRDLRVALIHGARAVLRWADRHEHAQSQWLLGLQERRGKHRTIVAFANKMARIGWAIVTGEGEYERCRAFRPQTPRQAAA